jgi:hypothetical protein
VNARMMRCTVGVSRRITLSCGVSAGGGAVRCAIAKCVNGIGKRRPESVLCHLPANGADDPTCRAVR